MNVIELTIEFVYIGEKITHLKRENKGKEEKSKDEIHLSCICTHKGGN